MSASKMTYTVSRGALNSTHSLTQLQNDSVVEQWLLNTWDKAWGRAETDTTAVQYGVMNA